MKNFTLTNEQRKYFGIEPIKENQEKIILEDKYQTTTLYFEKDIIRRQIISNNLTYKELQFSESTKDRKILLPKKGKGKEQKLSNSTLEKRKPYGNYVEVSVGYLTCGNFDNQKTFYSTRWHKKQEIEKSCEEIILDFINESPSDHLIKINKFLNEKRQNVKYKTGDFFKFKINRTEYGFGRILLDINKIRKQKLIDNNNGLNYLMGPPLLIQFFAYKSDEENVDIEFLESQIKLPSDYIMDNLIFYGEYEIIGNKKIKNEELDFPISYGKRIEINSDKVFLQWGLIHLELPIKTFSKYLIIEDKPFSRNPYGFYSIGFYSGYGNFEIENTINNNGKFDYSKVNHYKSEYDLRNPKNSIIRNEIFSIFGLDSDKDYLQNSMLTSTPLPNQIIEKIKQLVLLS